MRTCAARVARSPAPQLGRRTSRKSIIVPMREPGWNWANDRPRGTVKRHGFGHQSVRNGFGISNLTNFSRPLTTLSLPGQIPASAWRRRRSDAGRGMVGGSCSKGDDQIWLCRTFRRRTFIDGVDLSAIYIVAEQSSSDHEREFWLCETVSPMMDLTALSGNRRRPRALRSWCPLGTTARQACDPNLFNLAPRTVGIAGQWDASTPFNVAVGGTDFDDAANPSTYWTATNSGAGAPVG